MTNDQSQLLAQELDRLPYLTVLASTPRAGGIELLLRCAPGQETLWASAVSVMLRTAAAACEEQFAFHLHICRQYLLRPPAVDGDLVYGWHVRFEAESEAFAPEALAVLLQTLRSIKPPHDRVDPRFGIDLHSYQGAGLTKAPPVPEPLANTAVQRRQIDLAQIRRPRVGESDVKGNPIVPIQHRTDIAMLTPGIEADAAGNPIVPTQHRAEEIPFAGMDQAADRNRPAPGTTKGAYSPATTPWRGPGR